MLHRRVPLEHAGRAIEDNERFAEAVEEALGNLVLLRNARHPPSMNAARPLCNNDGACGRPSTPWTPRTGHLPPRVANLLARPGPRISTSTGVSFTDLREFVEHLEKRGRLRRITAPVSRDLEITEITDRVEGPGERNVALLFERVEGFHMPSCINAFGSRERMAWALGVERLDELGERVAKLLDLKLPGTFIERLRSSARSSTSLRPGPKRVSGALPGGRRDRRPSLAGAADLWCWPKDAGRYITLPARDHARPRHGPRNVGMYRIQVYDERTLGMHWQTHKGGAEHQREAAPHREAAHARWPSRSAATPRRSTRRRRRCRPGVDEMVLAGLAARQRRRDGEAAGRSTSRCRPTPRSCSRATSTPRERASRGRSATTRATTRSPATTRSSTSPRSRAARDPIYPTTIVGPAAAGGLLARQGDRAPVPADHPDDAARRSST